MVDFYGTNGDDLSHEVDPPTYQIDNMTGVDSLFGFGGDDILQGYLGADHIYGLGDDDFLHGYRKDKTALDGNDGGDFLYGGDGADKLYGDHGADTLYGDYYLGYNDVLDGGEGIDTASYYYSAGAFGVFVHIEDGYARDGMGGTDTLISIENARGSAAGDYFVGDGRANVFTGDGGDDYFEGGDAGVDTYNGGDGRDRVDYFAATDGVSVHLDLGWALDGHGDQDIFFSIESITGSSFNDSLDGNEEDNIVLGAGGNDTIRGRGGLDALAGASGNDWIDGGAGADTMQGGLDDDTYLVDNAADQVFEVVGQGVDLVYTSTNYVLAAGQEIESLLISGTRVAATVNLTGNAFGQLIQGHSGANTLIGGGGRDTLRGLGGADIYLVDSADDMVVESAGGGSDRVAAGVSYVLQAGQEVELLTPFSYASTHAINLTGNEFAQTLIGNDGRNTLDGRGGADSMSGLGGDDFHIVDHAGDRVIESAGGGFDRVAAGVSYQLPAGQEIELMTPLSYAGTTALDLGGNEFAQSIIGNAGVNVINGGLGNDILTGGGGADMFLFNTALSAATNVDAISDYNVALDTIRLENAVFTGLATGLLAAGAFNAGAAATEADDRIIYNMANGALIFDADGLGGAAGIRFATLSGGLAMTNADFVVV